MVDRRTVKLNRPICADDICINEILKGAKDTHQGSGTQVGTPQQSQHEPFEGGIVFPYLGDGCMECQKGVLNKRNLGLDDSFGAMPE